MANEIYSTVGYIIPKKSDFNFASKIMVSLQVILQEFLFFC